jgi:putative ABC transport system ATP-binding protein
MQAMVAPKPLSKPLLQASGLRKIVPGGRVLFSGLELAVAPGEFVAIMGESGAGKSTLLNLIAGLDTADEGSIAIKGQSLDRLSDDERTQLRRRAIGFVFQAFHLLPHLTLAQNVALPLVLQGVGGKAALDRASHVLRDVGLAGRDADYPRQLSGGELQRVAIARALVHAPALILADEPTGNLDPDTAAKILELFSAQIRQSGASVVLVTHSRIAAAVADRIWLLTSSGLAPG